jgi:hypothetical protein
MLTFVYHPIDAPRVVEEDEAEKMQASGMWFDCPKKARNYRQGVEDDIKSKSTTKSKGKVK